MPARSRPAPPGDPADSPLSVEDVSRGMIVRRLHVAPEEVVFVKGVIEASDGVAALFAVSGGALAITAPLDRGADLAELVADLERETARPGAGPELPGISSPGAEEPRADG